MDKRKTALVTGGSRGIGRAICKALADMDMNVIYTSRSRIEDCDCPSIHGYQADVTDAKACADLFQYIKTEYGGLDVLVNNAGITRDGLILRMSDGDYQDVMDTNAKGAFLAMREAAKLMLRQKSGKIINITSVVGIHGNAGQVNYAASKAAVIGMTKSLAKELASRGICVNAVAPGMIETAMTEAMTEAAKEQTLAQIPFHRMGKPEDIADMAAFLAGDKSDYITGQVFCVDGGMTI